MLSFANAPQNLFNRLGKCALVIKQAKSYQTAQQPNLIDATNGLTVQLAAEPDIQALVGNSYISILNTTDSTGATMQNIAGQIINRMVFRDNPQANQTLTQLNVWASILEVIRQMKIQGATVLSMTVGATVTGFGAVVTNVGNGIISISMNRPWDGKSLENVFAETISVTCQSDSYQGGATAGNEPFLLTGKGLQQDVFAFDWPLGSGCSTNLSAVDSGGGDDILTNSAFSNWTGGVPDNFALVTGTGGVNTVQDNGIIYGGTSSLKLVGDGTTLITLQQHFDNAAGTSTALTPLTQYSINLFMRRDGMAAGAGSLVIELVDANGVVINDANGVPNNTSVNLTALTTSYAAVTVQFRTPLALPANSYLQFRMATALSNGRGVYLAKLTMTAMTQIYNSGPFVAIHAGSTPFATGDYTYVNVTNSRGAGGTLSTWQTTFAQLYNFMIYYDILLPSSLTPTISDNLIS